MSQLPKVRVKEVIVFGDKVESLDLYLNEIGKEPLLTPKEEIRLARLAQQGNAVALERLTMANLRFVVSVAKQYQNQGVPLNDLINEGNIGLIIAVKKFDVSLGFKLISYAVWWIRQQILQALAQQGRIVRLPANRVNSTHKIQKAITFLRHELNRDPNAEELARFLDMRLEEIEWVLHNPGKHLSLDAPIATTEDRTLNDALSDTLTPAPDEEVQHQDMRKHLEEALDTLTPREAEVISMYYGLGGNREMTLNEIGKRYGLTRERVRQIRVQALHRLRHPRRSRKLRTYH